MLGSFINGWVTQSNASQQFHKCHNMTLVFFAIKRAYFDTVEENLDNFQC